MELVAGRAQRRLHEAEVKADTAAHMAEKVRHLLPWLGCLAGVRLGCAQVPRLLTACIWTVQKSGSCS